MRPILPGDIAAAGCALLALPAHKRAGAILEMLNRADAANRYRKALGHAHPEWGNGSLASVVMPLHRRDEPVLNDPDYVDCMLTIFAALKARNERQKQVNRTRS